MIYTIFLVPILIVVVGIWMYKYPPKKINIFVGYRTKKSMKDKDAWEKAHKYCGKMWMLMGVIMVVLSFVLYLLTMLEIITFTENNLAIITLGQVGVILLSILLVENKLRKYIGE